MDGGGERVAPEALELARDVVTQLPLPTVGELRFYPTGMAAVHIGWQRYTTGFSLDIGPGNSIHYDEVDFHTGSSTEKTLTFDDLDDVRVLVTGE